MKNLRQMQEAFDLLGILGHYSNGEAQTLLARQYDVLAWVLCDGESAQHFENLLNIGRRFMEEQGGVVTRVLPDGSHQPGEDYRKRKP